MNSPVRAHIISKTKSNSSNSSINVVVEKPLNQKFSKTVLNTIGPDGDQSDFAMTKVFEENDSRNTSEGLDRFNTKTIEHNLDHLLLAKHES
jgi:hypothetical protein